MRYESQAFAQVSVVAVLASKFGPKFFMVFLGQAIPKKIPQHAAESTNRRRERVRFWRIRFRD
tara:strand:+ start:95 stop:283 length:189 start_codon:yes stop_codon:yes gene_type:complete